ncbi:MAG: hypothetical protein H8E67_07845 [Proteobacteria bacterium]|nr:hypothetical protein [Pseudomonadota bacterium]
MSPDEFFPRQESFQYWTPKKRNLNEKAQGTVWFMLDLPESSKKRVIEVRNLNILSFEAFLKSGISKVIVIYEYAVNLSQSLYFTVDSNPGKSKFLFIAKQKIGRLILGFESQKVRGEMLDRSLLKRWQMKNSRYKRK